MFFIYSQRDELNLHKNKNITFCDLDNLNKDTILKFKSCHNNKNNKIKHITWIFKNYGIINVNTCSFNQYNFSTHLTTCSSLMSLNSQTIPVCCKGSVSYDKSSYHIKLFFLHIYKMLHVEVLHEFQLIKLTSFSIHDFEYIKFWYAQILSWLSNSIQGTIASWIFE